MKKRVAAMLLLAAVVAGAIVYLSTCLGTWALYPESSVLADVRNLLVALKRAWEGLRSRPGDPCPETPETH